MFASFEAYDHHKKRAELTTPMHIMEMMNLSCSINMMCTYFFNKFIYFSLHCKLIKLPLMFIQIDQYHKQGKMP